jgi:two-component system response regulator HydG
MDRLLRYDWPGNVRELMNTVERGVVLTRSEYIDEGELTPVLLKEPGEKTLPPGEAGAVSLEALEKATILKTLDQTGGNKSEAARRLGITRRTLHQKLKKYGMM